MSLYLVTDLKDGRAITCAYHLPETLAKHVTFDAYRLDTTLLEPTDSIACHLCTEATR